MANVAFGIDLPGMEVSDPAVSRCCERREPLHLIQD
jgi:hypothetical protein